jgi:hypothetical protein
MSGELSGARHPASGAKAKASQRPHIRQFTNRDDLIIAF